LAAASTLLALAGCAANQPYDYTNYRAHPPRSILVLPPVNESVAVEGTYGYLSTVSQPLAELGYYVFPVALVDQLLKENGMPTAYEMHQVALNKVVEITGADAVLYPTLKVYGSKYHVLSSDTTVHVAATLVDTRTGSTLWQGEGIGQQGSGGSGNIFADMIAAAVVQAINSGTDRAHGVSRLANVNMLYKKKAGLPFGPYSARSGTVP
jgi:hypothetical protein